MKPQISNARTVKKYPLTNQQWVVHCMQKFIDDPRPSLSVPVRRSTDPPTAPVPGAIARDKGKIVC